MKAFSQQAFAKAAEQLVVCGRDIAARGWSPATSSNYSIRLNEKCCAITISGRDKSCLNTDDIMAVDFDAAPLSEGRPSAETLLHTGLYRQFVNVGAILHIHSLAATVLSRYVRASSCVFENYELLKAFAGLNSHENRFELPIFENTQAIDELAYQVDTYLKQHSDALCYGYLIRGHGLYAWGKNLADAFRHLEAFEFLMSCELETLKLGHNALK